MNLKNSLQLIKSGFRLMPRLIVNFVANKLKNGGHRIDFNLNLSLFIEIPSMSNGIEALNKIAVGICESLGRKTEKDKSIARTILLVLTVGLIVWAVNNIFVLFKMIFQ